MKKLRKRYILLFFVILIPILLAFLVGLYGYNSDKFGQGVWKNEYKDEYLDFKEDLTTKDKIREYLQYGVNTQYHIYDSEAVFSSQIKNTNAKSLFTIEIFQTIIQRDKSVVDSTDSVQYLIFIYDVQYLTIRDMFEADITLRDEINAADIPSISVTISEVLDDDADEDLKPRNKTVSVNFLELILDDNADVDTIEGEVLEKDNEEDQDLVYIYNSSVIFTEADDWSEKSLVEVKGVISDIKDESNESLSVDLWSEELTVFETVSKDINQESFQSSYKQDLSKTGYLGWLIGHYLWWICLIALVAIGAITVSFYLVWVAEENALELKQKSKKKK